MVNGISGYNPNPAFYKAAAGVAVLHQNDVQNMVKFLNGQPVQGTSEPTIGESVKGTIPFLALFGGFQGIGALKNNGLEGAEKEAFKAAKKAGTAKGWNFTELNNNIKAQNPYTRGQFITAGKDRIAKEYGNFFKKAVTVDPKRGTIGKCLDKLPGYSKLRATGFGQAMGKSGAGWMAVMDGAVETFTQVVPTFSQLGAGAGFKQIAKSGTKVLAGAGGWLAGDALGKGIGAAIGTAICPGIGTAIGGFVGGFLGGIVGSAVAGKAAKAITGKNELEKLQDEQMAQATQQIEADPQTKLALAQQAKQQAETVLAQDPTNKDALAAKASAENILAQTQEQNLAEATVQNKAQEEVLFVAPQTALQGSQPANSMVPPVPGFNGTGYDMNQYSQAASKAAMPIVPPMNTVNPFAQQKYQTQQAV